ncbi:SLATT domain-containing protein [Moorena bouillonii]|uniref:SMODS and SLOG-associating 2TM effector domain-containing protein n=1 Tax=Moorena bouillonii PNG TaxID=568701 RepID=A0A1U7MXM2_9CYAN|nr:SLATT domain-containing protein [Moorena bouillonii]OLT58391.1 hypothetical protein BJP37_04325 [Moorena bouillonii PNG]
MEHHSQDEYYNAVKILESQIRECFGRVVWTQKNHDKCSNLYKNKLDRLKITEIILSALVTTSLLISIFGNHNTGTIVAAILSTFLLIIQIYTKDYDLQKYSKDHAVAAHELWNIRELYISLLADIKSGIIKVDDIKAQRDELQQQLKLIYKNAPRTNTKAYIQTGKALKQNGKINQGEEMTLSDEEIDRFLPTDLHKNS